MNNFYRKYQFALIFLIWSANSAIGQYKLLEDANASGMVKQTIDSIYNLNFKAADSLIEILDGKLGDYPGNSLLRAFYINWKYKPIKAEHESFGKFEGHLIKAIEQSEKMLEKNENDEEANFFLLASHAFLAELYVNNGSKMKALGEAKNAYKYIKIGFEQIDKNPEFYFTSGIYNYYREKYPEENPFFKSFIWMFKSGDKEEGLKMLKSGFDQASFTQAECLTYLFHINLRYEDKPFSAIYYSRLLKDKYPNNLHYISIFVENSIRLQQYRMLPEYLEKLLASEKNYYKYLGKIFSGYYSLFQEKDARKSITHFSKANAIGAIENERDEHRDSMLFFGLGMAYKEIGDDAKAKEYLKLSIKNAEYHAYRKEAQEKLNSL